jgi:hypothetical protein
MYSVFKIDNLFVEAQATNPDYSAELDTSIFQRGPIFLNVACNATGTDTPAITVEHATASGGTFAAVPAAALFNILTGAAGTFTTPTASTAQDEVLGLNLQQCRRFVRVVLTGAVSSARTFSIAAGGQYQYTETEG